MAGGWPRTVRKQDWPTKGGHNDIPWEKTVRELLNEIKLFGATHPIISSDLELRNDGLPYANQRMPGNSGVAVYFVLKGEQRCIPCDRYSTPKHNIRAISKTIEAMRGIERWGSGEMMKRTLHAFAALPAPRAKHWSQILEVSSTWDMPQIEAAYRKKARECHPDNGGSHDAMAEINAAVDEARKAKAGK